ncbi:hypothetical protein Hanom_Chr03g00213611 [Helianthus anomalus]
MSIRAAKHIYVDPKPGQHNYFDPKRYWQEIFSITKMPLPIITSHIFKQPIRPI